MKKNGYVLLNPVNNLVFGKEDGSQVLTIYRNLHSVDGFRLCTVIDETPSEINVYTEKLSDIAERYNLDVDFMVKQFNILDKASTVISEGEA
jgi:hypothetical protein